MNYTKGEWKVISGFKIRCGIEQMFVADCWTSELQLPRPRLHEAEANAYLIAAAPELYEALKKLVGFDEIGGNGKDHYILIKKAKQALAKAEGK